MTKIMRKTVSILLLLAMVVSFCSMAFVVSAEETAPTETETEEVTVEEGLTEAAQEAPPQTEPIPETEAPAPEESEPPQVGEEPVPAPSGEGEAPVPEDAPIMVPEYPVLQPGDELQANGDRGILNIVQWIALKSRVTFSYTDKRDNSRHTFASTNMHIRTITTANGTVYRAFCIEPVLGVQDGGSYKEKSQDDAWLYGLDDAQREAILLILAYGAKYRTSATSGYEDAAIQVLVWEIISGQRNKEFPYNVVTGNTSTNKTSIYTAAFGDGTGAYAATKNLYEAIVSRLSKHGVVPSFTSRQQNAAPTHSMTYDAARGVYTITLTDANKVLADFNFSMNGATVTRNGNTLKIETSDISQISGKLFSAAGDTLNRGSIGSVVVWAPYSESDTIHQTVVCYNGGKPDPVYAYFKLQPGTTTLEIRKQSSDGNVAGISFTVTDAAGTTIFTGETDADGRLDVPNLNIGDTVTVTETVPEHYISENRTQTIALAAGTNTLTFVNHPMGEGTMQKISEDGDVEGYYFRLYRFSDASAGISSKTWCGKSDADGNVYLTDLEFNEPTGERVYTFMDLTDGKYSLRELLSLYGAGEVQTESFTIRTSGGLTPACEFVFSGEELLEAENGDRYVMEVPLTGLTGGGRLTITIQNRPILVPGSLTVKKVDPQNRPLAGVSFLLEYSLDNGANWSPVFYRDAESDPVPGGCTEEGLAEGKLTTGEDGLASFIGLYTEHKDTHVLYRLTEIQTVPGYSLLLEPVYEGTIAKDQELDLSFTVVNAPAFEMPMTGGNGVAFTAVSAFAALLSAAALMLLWKKHNEKASHEARFNNRW